MPRERPVISTSTRKILELVKTGRLRDIESWLADGNSLRIAELKPEASILSLATKTGFHSLVVVILQDEEWTSAELGYALNLALYDQRFDLVDWLLSAGAQVGDICFREACRTMNALFIQRLLEGGVDPEKENAFARALNEHKAGLTGSASYQWAILPRGLQRRRCRRLKSGNLARARRDEMGT